MTCNRRDIRTLDSQICICIVNDIGNFAFVRALASIEGLSRSRKQKFVMSFAINYGSISNRIFQEFFCKNNIRKNDNSVKEMKGF